MAQFLDLVALGTVTDVVPLDQNNRILVEQGLRRIRAGNCVPGMQQLLRVAGRDAQRVVAADLGFAVGPRLNAAGRLQDMSLGIECLLTDDEQRAHDIAVQLNELNQQRRHIERQMHAAALSQVEQTIADVGDDVLPSGLCLYDESWHQGVVGIVASRIKERFHRPVVAFADAGNGEIKGSARSIPDLHMRDLLEKIAIAHPDLISKFGGHAMAAGLTVPLRKLAQFRKVYEAAVHASLSQEQLSGQLYTDGELGYADVNLEIAQLLRYAGPWGQAFPEPLFDGIFKIIDQRLIGGKHLKLQVKMAEGIHSLEAIAFNVGHFEWHRGVKEIHIVYRLDINEYRGSLNPQLVVTHLQPANA